MVKVFKEWRGRMVTQPLDLSETELSISALELKIETLGIDGIKDPELQRLRGLTIDAHYTCELLMQSIIAKHLFKQASPDYLYSKNGDKPYIHLFKADVFKFFEEMRFKSKLEMCLEFRVIENDLYRKIGELNTTRNYYSHPMSHKLEFYTDQDRKLYLLQLIFDCVDGLKKIDQTFHLG